MRRGARDLNLDVAWRRAFVPAGTVSEPTADAVWLDVGGNLLPGMLDSHQGGQATTAELVVRHPELVYGHLMPAWLRRADDGQDLRGRPWSPVLVAHAEPDFDCVVSSLLVERLVEDGDLPVYAQALTAYSAEVDTGRYAMSLSVPASWTVPVHMAYLLLQSLKRDLGLDNTALVELGMAMVRAVCDAILDAKGSVGAWDFTPHRLPSSALNPALRAAVEQAALAWQPVASRHKSAGRMDLVERLAAQPDDFQKDLGERATEDQRVGRAPTARLPADDGGEPIDVPVWVAPVATRCALNKYFVRAAGFPYFICPIPNPGATTGHAGRVIVSLDPAYADSAGRKPTLQGLGYRLERAETTKRAQVPGGDPRIPIPRWQDGSVENDDPWYDGRGHGHTIVDSPRCGTLLEDAEVVALAVGGDFWKTRLESARLFVVVAAGPAGHADTLAPAPASSLGAPPTRADLPGLAPAVALWRSSSLDLDPPPGSHGIPLSDLPPHFERGREFLRVSPDALAVDGRRPAPLGVTSIVAASSATLDDLTAWVERLARSPGVLHVVAILRPERGAWPPRKAQLYARMCLGEVSEMPPSATGDLVLLNGRIVAMNLGPATSNADPDHEPYTTTLCELMLYAAFQESALTWFSTEIATAVAGRQSSSALRQAFLLFRTQYLCREPALMSDARRVYQAVIGALGLDRELDKVTAEMDSLQHIDEDRDEAGRQGAEASRRRVEAFLNGVLGVVAVTGIIEAVGIDWRRLSGWQWVVMAIGVSLATALIVPRVRRLVGGQAPTVGGPP